MCNHTREESENKISKLRHGLDYAPRKEPTGDESFPR
jgi:hypothetical protein